MGKRVRVAKSYKVEYGNKEAFYWKQDEFINLLETLGCSVCRYDTEDYSAIEFEVDVAEYEHAMAAIKAHIEASGLHDDAERKDLHKAIEATGEAPDELLKTMQAYYDEADKHDGSLHFSSF